MLYPGGMTNRKSRRQAARSSRGASNGGAQRKRIYRIFAALKNQARAQPLAKREFAELDGFLELIEIGLENAKTPNPEHWLPNSVAAHACLVRAYQGLQASANLCMLGFYVESLATLRGVYEAAGLARSLAHKSDVAERWLHGGDWVKDKFSREFAQEMQADEDNAERLPHWDFYQLLSKYAHPMAKSTLQFLFARDASYRPALYPEFDVTTFVETARMITAEAVFVAYTFRNAAAEPDVIPGWWHEQLAERARRFTGDPMEHLNEDWAAQQARYEQLTRQIQHDDVLLDVLRNDPNSVQNLRRRAEEAGAGTGQG